ncbi:hypothetical protein HG530_010086 [Fusarium avenaceum]|nr:hypothetical protein HG530_010086 [Fusarium avenaceum]
MKTDDIAFRQKVFKIFVLAIFLESCSKSNLSDADDADSLAIECLSEETIEGKVPFTNAIISAMCLAIEGLNKSNGELCDSLGRDDVVVDNIIDEDADGIGSLDKRDGVLIKGKLVKDEFDARRVVLGAENSRQVLLVVGLCAEYGELHAG